MTIRSGFWSILLMGSQGFHFESTSSRSIVHTPLPETLMVIRVLHVIEGATVQRQQEFQKKIPRVAWPPFRLQFYTKSLTSQSSTHTDCSLFLLALSFESINTQTDSARTSQTKPKLINCCNYDHIFIARLFGCCCC